MVSVGEPEVGKELASHLNLQGAESFLFAGKHKIVQCCKSPVKKITVISSVKTNCFVCCDLSA